MSQLRFLLAPARAGIDTRSLAERDSPKRYVTRLTKRAFALPNPVDATAGLYSPVRATVNRQAFGKLRSQMYSNFS